MYKALTADDYRKHLGIPQRYEVDGFVAYGTFRSYPFEQFENALSKLKPDYKEVQLKHDSLAFLKAFAVDGRNYWIAKVYGSALLSEYLHLACIFGSKKNILVGSCGELKKGISSMELVIPTWSFAEESSAKAYIPAAEGKYWANKELSARLAKKLLDKYRIHKGPTTTCQAMMAETWEDIVKWSKAGFCGVEMEAATVFAVSQHFNVPAAAILRIADNLIEAETVLDTSYKNAGSLRRQVSQDILDTVVRELLINDK